MLDEYEYKSYYSALLNGNSKNVLQNSINSNFPYILVPCKKKSIFGISCNRRKKTLCV